MTRRAIFLVVVVLWALAGRASVDTVMTGVIRLGYPVRAVVDDGQGQIYLLTGRGLERKSGDGFELVDPNFRQMPCIVGGEPVECTLDPAFREMPYFEANEHWQAQFPGNTRRYTEAQDADGQVWVCTGTELYTFELASRPEVFLAGQSVRGILVDDGVLYANTYRGFFVGDSCVWPTESLHASNLLLWRDTLYSFCHGIHQWPGRVDAERGDMLFSKARPMVDRTWLHAESAVGTPQYGHVHEDTLWVCGPKGLGWWDGQGAIVPANVRVDVQQACTVDGELFALPRWGGVMVRRQGGDFGYLPGFPKDLICYEALGLQGPEPLNSMVAFATDKGIGIWHQEEQTFSLMTIRDGLPSNMICGLAQDEWGHLWASTFSGLVRISLTHHYLDTFLPTVEFNRKSHFFDQATKTHLWGSINGVYATQLHAFPQPRVPGRHRDEAGLANGPRWLWAVLLAVVGSIVFFITRQSRQLKRSEADLFITQLEAMVLARLPNVSVESLAQASGLSLRTFYRRMEDHGTKPGEFLREIRLKQARSLLEDNEGMQVAEVAKRVGYSEAHLRRLLDEGPDA